MGNVGYVVWQSFTCIGYKRHVVSVGNRPHIHQEQSAYLQAFAQRGFSPRHWLSPVAKV